MFDIDALTHIGICFVAGLAFGSGLYIVATAIDCIREMWRLGCE